MRRFGADVVRWGPDSSPKAALARMLAHRRVDTVLDVGANEGQYALLLRELGYAGRIVSFEPLAAPHQQLRESAARDPLWTVAQRMALGDREGEIAVNVASNGGASSSILAMLETHRRAAPDTSYVGIEVVPMSRLDCIAGEFVGGSRNIFLKVDVQGYELEVLKGATGLLPAVVGAQLEVSLVPLYDGQSLFAEMTEWMQAKGFHVWGIMPGFADNSSGRLLQADFIFFRG
jgi:FkbM family methyltransferase